VAGKTLSTGKLPAKLLAELLSSAAPGPPELLLGPAVGEDACAIDVPSGVLIAATDPITLTGSGVGAHAVEINANDVAVMGARPRWFLASVLLPVGTTESEVRELFESTLAALQRLGATLVGGHTEVTDAVARPLVVGQMLGLCEDGHFVRTGGARPGDVVLQVGPVPVEGAAVLAAEASRLESVDPALLARARGALREPGISVVKPALLAAQLGAHALHDPTEGGLSVGLYELAEASSVRLVVDPEEILWFDPGTALCAALGADPWGTLASGCLLAAFPEGPGSDAALEALAAAGHPARIIATATRGSGVELLGGRALPRFERDELARILPGA
jgi:hydrogenase maturation factor